jgi:hypothetical protein
MYGRGVRVLSIGLVAVLVAVGCGDDGPDNSSSPRNGTSADASKFAKSYGARHKRPGETLEFFGCRLRAEDEDPDDGYACDVVYRPLRGLRFDLLPEGERFRVVHVRRGVRRGLELPGLTD